MKLIPDKYQVLVVGVILVLFVALAVAKSVQILMQMGLLPG